VASRLGSLFVVPELLTSLHAAAAAEQSSSSSLSSAELRVVEKGFRVLSHCLHSDHPGTMRAMAAHIPQLDQLAGRYLALPDSAELRKVRVLLYYCSSFLSLFCDVSVSLLSIFCCLLAFSDMT
jgi:hypothetical protein